MTLDDNHLYLKYFDIVWLSSVDGPNTRVTLFLQGCNLRCPWCHSPHSWSCKGELLYFDNRCLKCSACVKSCPAEVHKISDNIHSINRERCIKCRQCINSCPVSTDGKWNESALGFAGTDMKINDLFQLLLPQLLLLKNIGGITISGGEPLMQAKAVRELLILCKEKEINTSIETSFSVGFEKIKPLINLVDHWLIGLRPVEKIENKNLNIGDIDIIEKNIKLLVSFTDSVIIRFPVIPNYTDNQDCYSRIRQIMKNNNIKNIDIIPYNFLADHYYKAMGTVYPLGDMKDMDKYDINKAEKYFTKHKFNTNIITGGIL